MDRHLAWNDHPFAVKEHRSSNLHWDLRFHLFGDRLLSFYAQEPPHLDPTCPLRIFRTEDHQLKYLRLERIILPGQPGAGPTAEWDYGFFRVQGEKTMLYQLNQGHLRILVFGQRLVGGYSLKWVGPREDEWNLIKEWDIYADCSLRFPNVLTPQKIRELEEKLRPRRDRDSMDLFENFQRSSMDQKK